MIEFAREWGTKMLTPAELWAELKRFTPHPLCPKGGEKSEKRHKSEKLGGGGRGGEGREQEREKENDK